MIYFIEAVKYITADPYFLISMGLTSSIGIFIGALLYDGLLDQFRKGLVALLSYTIMLSLTNLTRIVPIIVRGEVHDPNQPFAGLVTIFFVSAFYISGMYLGIRVTLKAHKNRHEGRRIGDKPLSKI